MNKREARAMGIESGIESATYGDFIPDELSSEARFLEACCEVLENKRQYADDPTYDIAQCPNSEGLFDAYDAGEIAGVLQVWRAKYAEKGVKVNPLC